MDSVSIRSIKHVQTSLAALRIETFEQAPREVRQRLKREARKIARDDVFGENHKTDKDGNPIEHGLGSPSNMTKSHIAAFVKYNDMTKQANIEALARFEKQLAECEARRRAEKQKLEADEDGDD